MFKPTLKKRIIVYSSLITFIIGSLYAMTYMPGKSYSGVQPTPTIYQSALASKYKKQLEVFATTPHNSQNIGQLHAAEDYIYAQIEEAGYKDIVVQKYLDIESKNFEVTLNPKEKHTGTVVIGAHYDSAHDSPGADDNGSSVVILLELAKRFKEKFNSNHIRLKIVFFANEEPPFFGWGNMGSEIYAKKLYKEHEPVIAMYAFDALGYYSDKKGTQHYPYMFAPFYSSVGNFVGFVGNVESRKLVVDSLTAFRSEAKFPSEGISTFAKIPGIDFSDHRSFYEYNWPALMVTDTAYNRNLSYHTSSDTIDKLDLMKMAQLTDELEKMFRILYEK